MAGNVEVMVLVEALSGLARCFHWHVTRHRIEDYREISDAPLLVPSAHAQSILGAPDSYALAEFPPEPRREHW
jgi:hypothetical protein